MIILSAGMQKAGSGWYFNLTNDLLVQTGYDDIRILRGKFKLGDFLKDFNCNMGDITSTKCLKLMIPHAFGHTFVVKTHGGPSFCMLRVLCALKAVKITYIFRDPRDVALSAFEHGEKIRARGRKHTFGKLQGLPESIEFAKSLLPIWDNWLKLQKRLPNKVLIARYEDLVADPIKEMNRLADFIGIHIDRAALTALIKKYSGGKPGESLKGLHFNKGSIGRFREVMGEAELKMCKEYFDSYLERMGYKN